MLEFDSTFFLMKNKKSSALERMSSRLESRIFLAKILAEAPDICHEFPLSLQKIAGIEF
jgi:hypothetical protein